MEDLSIQTHALGVLAQKEAVAVRIITVLSLLYLPCTVVSVSRITQSLQLMIPVVANLVKSFFSTDVVKYQQNSQGPGTQQSSNDSIMGQSFSHLAMNRWLQVTLPFTLITLVLGWLGFTFEKWRQSKELEEERQRERERLSKARPLPRPASLQQALTSLQ
jgi:hypothetical protein